MAEKDIAIGMKLRRSSEQEIELADEKQKAEERMREKERTIDEVINAPRTEKEYQISEGIKNEGISRADVSGLSVEKGIAKITSEMKKIDSEHDKQKQNLEQSKAEKPEPKLEVENNFLSDNFPSALSAASRIFSNHNNDRNTGMTR